LKLGDRHAADAPLARPLDRGRKRRLRNAYRACRDLDSPGIEHLERRAKAGSFIAEPIASAHDAIERNLEHVRGAQPHRLFRR
jgi:hypothetical protein